MPYQFGWINRNGNWKNRFVKRNRGVVIWYLYWLDKPKWKPKKPVLQTVNRSVVLEKGDWVRSLTCCLCYVTWWALKGKTTCFLIFFFKNLIFSSSIISTKIPTSLAHYKQPRKNKIKNCRRRRRRRRDMNGEESFVEDCYGFVEIDPSGRYGRVWIIHTNKDLIFGLPFFDFGFCFCFGQYDEILGKGASKTV